MISQASLWLNVDDGMSLATITGACDKHLHNKCLGRSLNTLGSCAELYHTSCACSEIKSEPRGARRDSPHCLFKTNSICFSSIFLISGQCNIYFLLFLYLNIYGLYLEKEGADLSFLLWQIAKCIRIMLCKEQLAATQECIDLQESSQTRVCWQQFPTYQAQLGNTFNLISRILWCVRLLGSYL